MPVFLCVCVCVCVRKRREGERSGDKEEAQREQAGKQAYIRELEGFQESARSEGSNTWNEQQPRFKNKKRLASISDLLGEAEH